MMTNLLSVRMKFTGPCVLLAICWAAGSVNAAVVKLSLMNIVPGSETVTLVQNGDFEDFSSGNTHTPTGWTRAGDMFYNGQPAGVFAPNTGAGTARVHIDNAADPTGLYSQNIAGLAANTEYVLSAYMWHLGDATNGGVVEVDLNGVSGEAQLEISQSDVDANGGYFVYETFNTFDTGTSFLLRLFMGTAGLPDTGWPNQPAGGLWDNIAITPASQFVAPTVVPEPSTFILLGAGIVGICNAARRRKNRLHEVCG